MSFQGFIWFTIFTLFLPHKTFTSGLVAWERNNLKRESFLESYLFYRNLLEPWIKKICTCCQFHELFISLFLEIIHIALQCYHCNLRPFRQSWPIRLQENNNTFQEGWMRANQQFTKNNVTQSTEFNFDSKMFHQTISSYLKLCIQHRGDIFLWQSCYFVIYPTISLLLLPRIAITCRTTSQKYNYRLSFLPPFTHCMYLGCNWLILIHVVYFIS